MAAPDLIAFRRLLASQANAATRSAHALVALRKSCKRLRSAGLISADQCERYNESIYNYDAALQASTVAAASAANRPRTPPRGSPGQAASPPRSSSRRNRREKRGTAREQLGLCRSPSAVAGGGGGSAGANGAAGNAQRGGGGGGGNGGQHSAERDALTDDLIQMAGDLKERSLGINRSLRDDTRKLDDTASLTERNLEKVTTEKGHLASVMAKSALSCKFSCMVMVFVLVTFIGAYIFMKVVPPPRHAPVAPPTPPPPVPDPIRLIPEVPVPDERVDMVQMEPEEIVETTAASGDDDDDAPDGDGESESFVEDAEPPPAVELAEDVDNNVEADEPPVVWADEPEVASAGDALKEEVGVPPAIPTAREQRTVVVADDDEPVPREREKEEL